MQCEVPMGDQASSQRGVETCETFFPAPFFLV